MQRQALLNCAMPCRDCPCTWSGVGWTKTESQYPLKCMATCLKAFCKLDKICFTQLSETGRQQLEVFFSLHKERASAREIKDWLHILGISWLDPFHSVACL